MGWGYLELVFGSTWTILKAFPGMILVIPVREHNVIKFIPENFG